MPSKDERCLMPMGNSLVMTLPKAWLNFWQLKKGERVEIVYDGILVVIPSNHPKKEELNRKLMEVFFE